jgi:hypothetical protein
MDYPENASIIDPQEQQSDYYGRYDSLSLNPWACGTFSPCFTLLPFLPFIKDESSVLCYDNVLLELQQKQSMLHFPLLHHFGFEQEQ